MNACRIRKLVNGFSRFSLQKRASITSYTLANPKFSNFSFDDGQGGSEVYRHALKFQRPTRINLQSHMRNSVSFIGSVDRALGIANTRNGRLGVHTMLKVKSPRDPSYTFRILLMMWNELAETCVEHLKPKDLIFVSGCLESYTKADEDGKLVLRYQVIVKELNFVAKPDQVPVRIETKSMKLERDVGEAGMERRENELYLWQVFFTNPFEWWDNRRNKKNPRQPDFKHKDTGEVLWLSPKNPPWVKKQLELLDSKLAECLVDRSHRTRVSMWAFDE